MDLALLEEEVDLADGAGDVLDKASSREEEAVVPLDNLNDADELEREVYNISYGNAEYDEGFNFEGDADFEGDISMGIGDLLRTQTLQSTHLSRREGFPLSDPS